MILGSDLGRDKRFFSSPKHPDQLWDSFPGLKQLGCEGNH